MSRQEDKTAGVDRFRGRPYILSMTSPAESPHLRLCDACCDNSGTAKEMMKTGGCTCDICGWACKCCGGDGRQFVNKVLVRTIPDEGWAYLQWRNQRSLVPLDWEKLFLHGRREESGE